MAHGYTASHLQPIFDKYLQWFTATPATPAPSAKEPSNDRVFLHLPYHPLDPKSCEVQTLFQKHLLKDNPRNPYASMPLYWLSNGKGIPLGIHRLTVASTGHTTLAICLCPVISTVYQA